MFYIIRIAVFIVIFILLCKCIGYVKFDNEKQKKILIFFVFIVCIIVCLSPLVKNFMVFTTPEELFNKFYVGTIENIIYGDESCVIYYKNKKSIYSSIYLREKEKGYSVIDSFSVKKVAHVFDSSGSLQVYHIKNTDDYYIAGVDESYKSIEVYDAENNIVRSNIKRSKDSTFIYGFIDSFTSEYYIKRCQSGDGTMIDEND